jgi:hypothetical protein
VCSEDLGVGQRDVQKSSVGERFPQCEQTHSPEGVRCLGCRFKVGYAA